MKYDWRPEGLHCHLSIPRAQIAGAEAHPPIEEEARNVAGPNAVPSLAGKRLLVVEDEFLVGMMAKRLLESMGAVVLGPYGSLTDGLAAARRESFDGALLDFNLAGEYAEPLADHLMAHGIPFIFLTGYHRDSMNTRYANVPLLQKPIDADSLQRILVSLIDAPEALVASG